MKNESNQDPASTLLAEVHEIVEHARTRRVTCHGATATVEGESLALRDAEGMLVARFDPKTGVTEIAAARGDLRLSAPHGKVVVEAALDVEITAARDIVQHGVRKLVARAGAKAETTLRLGATEAVLEAPAVTACARRASLEADEVTTLAERVSLRATEVAWALGRMELRAERWRQRVRDIYSDVDGMVQTKAARIRNLVSESFHLSSTRTRLVSKEETSIDGKRVLLG